MGLEVEQLEAVQLEDEKPEVEELAEEPVKKPKLEVRIREARIYDIPQIVDLMVEFIDWQRVKGNKVYAEGQHLRGGVIIEIGAAFYNNLWKILIAERNNIVIGLLIGVMEHCGAIEKFNNCIRIKADYMKDNSLYRPKILRAMWNKMKEWGDEHKVGYYHGLIHPGNIPSIRTAKEVGFKHHTTQFLRLAQEEG